ncbi:MAG: hypothetical protein CFE24_05110 [Flavobacterium sp. BFFFF2]|nr:MAG: hypothetical protein CFE24_05110 [Flavobacterium sp. BFFFF2]
MENHFNNQHFLFWQKWLYYTSLLFALFGIVFALYGNNILFAPYNQMLTRVFWHTTQFPPEVAPFRAFIYGPLGGTICCCYILLAFIAKYAFKEKQKWARTAIIVAFSFWVGIDSSVCLYFGAYPQIYMVNAFSIIVKALPIIYTWNDFSQTRTGETSI